MKTLNIAEPDFLKAVQGSFAAESIDDIKVYLSWHVLHAYAPWLAKPFVEENFAFYGKVLTGAEELRPRWKRCVAETDDLLGEDLGRYYVEASFGPEHKKRMLEMVKELKAAYDADIDTVTWMGPKTKKEAHDKLAAIIDKIGYPDKWRDYSKVVVKADDLVGNIERATRFESERDTRKIGKPHDKAEWEMTPPTVNAYYDPSENDINFPAGILQPPFFQVSADDAVNFGAIGMVIGHEMTHGFDDQGRQYDKNGNLKDWWTKEDAKKFEERAACVVDQYGSYTAIDDLKQNGKATLGENLADNGGIRISLAALKKRLAGKPDPKIGGFTAEQRFFLGFAQVWCTNARDDAIRTQAMSDVHSLPEFRVNGTVSNSEDFAKAFACKADAPMVRGAKACRVW
jgi:endothelin-converting enzyme/putative endopeptidase